MIQTHAAVDVLHHHNSVVDQDADRENQREQRHAIEGESPRPRGEQRCRQGQQYCRTNDQGLAHPQREQHQQHHRGGGENQLLDQLLRLVIGSGAVVAGDAYFDAFRQHAVLQGVDTGDDFFGDIDCVFARLLGNGECHCRVSPAIFCITLPTRAGAVPDVLCGLVGAGDDGGHIVHVDRACLRHADDELTDVFGTGQKGACLHQDFLVVRHQGAGRLGRVGNLQGVANVLGRHAKCRHPVRVHHYAHGTAWAADGGDCTRTGDAFQLDFGGVRSLLQFVGATLGVARPQGDGNDGYIVDA